MECALDRRMDRCLFDIAAAVMEEQAEVQGAW